MGINTECKAKNKIDMVFTLEQKTQVIPQALNQYLEDKGIVIEQLAKKLKMSRQYIDEIAKGSTHFQKTEIKDKYYQNICDFIGLSLENEVWRHFNTANYQIITEAINNAKKRKRRVLIDGDTGAGKSYACHSYKKIAPKGTYIVTFSGSGNPREFVKNIAETVGAETNGTAGNIINNIIKHLTTQDYDTVLVIDECEHIQEKPGYINHVKSLADGLEGKCGFVICGMGLKELLHRRYTNHKQNYRQTYSRFSKRVYCTENIQEDIERICEDLGLSRGVCNWLKSYAKDFRVLREMIEDAFDESEKTGEAVSVELLDELYP